MKTPEGNLVKSALILRALSENPVVRLYLDGMAAGDGIPERLRTQRVVCFDLGTNMAPPIPDLEVTGTHVSGTLSFAGIGRFVSIPLEAVWGVALEGKGDAVFWEDVPEEIRAGLSVPPARKPKTPDSAEGAKVISLDEASRRLRGRPLRRGTASGTFPTTWEP